MDQQIPADACQVHKCFLFLKIFSTSSWGGTQCGLRFVSQKWRHSMWRVTIWGTTWQNHVNTRGKKTNIYKDIKILAFQDAEKMLWTIRKGWRKFGVFCLAKEWLPTSPSMDSTDRRQFFSVIFFGGGYGHTHCERFYFAACLHPRIQFLDS